MSVICVIISNLLIFAKKEMKEEFLHYLWQYQLFNKSHLRSTQGEALEIQKTGIHNKNSGPDFNAASLLIGTQLWAGNVEIHLKSSDWYVHNHEKDAAYDSVILHVVWEDDIQIFRSNNTAISALELKGLVPKNILNSYKQLFSTNLKWIACENNIQQVNQFDIDNWLERLYIERLERKSKYIEELLRVETNNWEAVLYQLLAKNYGLKVNADSFSEMTKATPFHVFRKESSKQLNLESLLFGQTGLLNKVKAKEDKYYKELQKIYGFQKNKYKLKMSKTEVAFFRLRPPNFPTIRLSQFANLYFNNVNLFQELIQENRIDKLYKLLESQTSKYWETHYSFDKKSKRRKKKTTKAFLDLLIINTIIPLKFTYQKQRTDFDFEPILVLIRELKTEKNTIITKFHQLGVISENALHSQALITLKNNYCNTQKCLQCKIGSRVLQQ